MYFEPAFPFVAVKAVTQVLPPSNMGHTGLFSIHFEKQFLFYERDYAGYSSFCTG